MKLSTFVRIVALTALTRCAGKIVVTRVPPDGLVAPMEGVYYALPRTVLKVEQPIERASQRPGRFKAFVPVFFPKLAASGDYVQEEKVTFSVGKASISSFGEPDPEQVFYVKTVDNGPVDLTGSLDYTEQGSVSGVSAQADNATGDIVMSVIGTSAGLAAKAFGAANATAAKSACGCKEETKQGKGGKLTVLKRICGFRGRIDQDRLAATYCRLESGMKEAIDTAAAKDDPSFELALEAYSEIYAMQAERSNLRQTPQSLSLAAALKDFDASIAAALAEGFKGSEKKESWTYTAELRDLRLDADLPLMRVHEGKGICFEAPLPAAESPPRSFCLESESCSCDEGAIRAALQGLATAQGSSEARRELEDKIRSLPNTLGAAKPLRARLALNPPRGQLFQILRSAAQTGERGLHYRIPATTDLTLSLGPIVVSRSKQMIAQLGVTASLPATTGGRTTAYTLKLYEATGALMSFSVTSKAVLQKGTADALGASLTSVAAANRAASDELSSLDHLSKVMAAKKAIYQDCKELNQACGGFVPSDVPLQQ